jgi:hypothetical protein
VKRKIEELSNEKALENKKELNRYHIINGSIHNFERIEIGNSNNDSIQNGKDRYLGEIKRARKSIIW